MWHWTLVQGSVMLYRAIAYLKGEIGLGLWYILHGYNVSERCRMIQVYGISER
jgi:hypothetical protein